MDDSKITEVYRKPINYPSCKVKVVEILYGEPTEFAMQHVDEMKLVFGGFCITGKFEMGMCKMYNALLKKNRNF